MLCFPLNNECVEVFVSGCIIFFGGINDSRFFILKAIFPSESWGASCQSKVAGTDALLRQHHVGKGHAKRSGCLKERKFHVEDEPAIVRDVSGTGKGVC